MNDIVIFELTHIYTKYEGQLIYSPKILGYFSSYESAQQAIRSYKTKPGFCDAPEAFSIRQRYVSGEISDDVVFETIIYLHSEDYEFEAEIDLGVYGSEYAAQEKLVSYCSYNYSLVNTSHIAVEKIVNKCVIGRKEWIEGFSVR